MPCDHAPGFTCAKCQGAPPHIAHEWAALTPREQRDVLRWAARIIQRDAARITR